MCLERCRVESERPLAGAQKPLPGSSNKVSWLRKYHELQCIKNDLPVSSRKLIQMRIACATCGYEYDHRSHGATMCPNCIRIHQKAMRQRRPGRASAAGRDLTATRVAAFTVGSARFVMSISTGLAVKRSVLPVGNG